MHPVFKIMMDETDNEVCFDFNSIVDIPAHLRSFDAYSQNKKRCLFIENEKMRITGVMIAEGTLIYRNDPEMGEHYVVFTAEEIEKFHVRWNELNYVHNLNKQHDSSQIIDPKDMFLIEQWIVRDGVGVPPSLKNQGIRPGSLMATYQIRSPKIWKEIKDGVYNGFSIEGLFIKSPMSINKVKIQQNHLSQEQIEKRLLYSYLNKFSV